MTLREKIEVMEAFERGEEIECAAAGYDIIWHYIKTPSWDWRENYYRIKPKPKQVVLIEKWLLKMQGTEQYAIEEGSKEELGIKEAIKAYDTKRNKLILRECVDTLRRCAELLEKGKSLTNEQFIASPAGDGYGSDDIMLCLTPNLEDYGTSLTAQDFCDSNPYFMKDS